MFRFAFCHIHPYIPRNAMIVVYVDTVLEFYILTVILKPYS